MVFNMPYFKVTNPLSSVYRLEDPAGVFLTLVVGEKRALLIDTGNGIGDAAAAVRAITPLPLVVANTHGHIDHAGGNRQFSEVWLNRADWQTCKASHNEVILGNIAEVLGSLPEGFDSDAFLSGYDEARLRSLEHGMCFDLGGVTLISVSTPSHTPGSMCFLCHELGLLLGGDCVGPTVYLVLPESSSIAEHIRIMDEISALPFKLILPAHYPEPLPKSDIELYIRCAQSARLEGSARFRNPFFPEYRCYLHFSEQEDSRGKFAALAFMPEKLEQEYSRCIH